MKVNQGDIDTVYISLIKLYGILRKLDLTSKGLIKVYLCYRKTGKIAEGKILLIHNLANKTIHV